MVLTPRNSSPDPDNLADYIIAGMKGPQITTITDLKIFLKNVLGQISEGRIDAVVRAALPATTQISDYTFEVEDQRVEFNQTDFKTRGKTVKSLKQEDLILTLRMSRKT